MIGCCALGACGGKAKSTARDMAAPPPPPTDVPLTVGQYNATLRFVVQVQVGDAPPFDALFDTGSAGLRLLPGAVPDSAFAQISSTSMDETFGNTLVVTGRIAMADVTIGGLTTPAPIPVEHIDSFGCGDADPGCVVDDEVTAHFSGLVAILGVGMRNSDRTPVIGNPIVQLVGQPSFIVAAPPFPGGTGNLRISPAAAEVPAFTPFSLAPDTHELYLPNQTPAWNDEAVPTCIDDETSGQQYCAGGFYDCGTPSTIIALPGQLGDATMLPAGDDVSVQIGATATTPAPLDYAFTVSATPLAGRDLVFLEATTGVEALNLGAAPYFAFDMFYDQL
ncbi:MAG TPA: DUF3443 family protein, partial [Polyangia bacterium]|nr:DUF3443 family protein [Polyangia bacterium]